jgi:predicted ATPase/DNA-binding SARP family transcriptional activator
LARVGLHVALLGGLNVSADGTAIDLRLSRSERALLVVLLLHRGEVVSRSKLIDELWPEDPPPTAAHAVQVYVSHLRRDLGRDVVVTTGSGYAVNMAIVDLDILDFEEAARRGAGALREGRFPAAAQVLSDALGLFTGEPLTDGLDMPTVQAENVRLAELRLGALEDRIEADLAAGMGAEVIGELRGLCENHYFRERLQAALMAALFQAGRQVEALEAYADYRSRCVDELGIEPGASLQELHQVMLSGGAGLAPVAAAQAPLPVDRPPVAATDLVGRDEDVSSVCALLAPGGARLVTVTGPGGVGKTRLVLEAVRTAGTSYPDGVCWVPLAALTDPGQAAGAIARALGLREDTDEPLIDLVKATLDRRGILLILDNLEHLLPGIAAVVSDLLGAGPDIKLLVTSRTALRVEGEQRFVLRPLHVAPAQGPTTRISPAAELFAARARAVRPGLKVDADTLPVIDAIVAQLDGLPLAIELAAARTNLLALPALLERLDRRLTLLTAAGGTSDHHASLRGAIAWSVDLLDVPRRRALARLTVFRGGFSLEAAEAVADHDRSSDEPFVDVLGGLIDASLITAELTDSRDVSAGSGRYLILETIREFAAEMLSADELDGPLARGAHARYLATYFRDIRNRVLPVPANYAEGARLNAEHDNLRVAIEHARDIGAADLFADLVLGAAGWQTASGTVAEYRGWLREIAEHTEDARSRTQATTVLVFLSCWEGGFLQARSTLLDLIEEPAITQRHDWLTAVQAMLCFCLAITDCDAQMRDRLGQQAMNGANQSGDPHLSSFVLSTVGGAICVAGDLDLAKPWLREAITVAANQNEMWECAAACNLADAHVAGGQAAEAHEWAQYALDIPLMRLSPLYECIANDLLGAALIAMGRPEEARPYLLRALAYANWSNSDRQFMEILLRFAVLSSIAGDNETACLLTAAHHGWLQSEGEVQSGSSKRLQEAHLGHLESSWHAYEDRANGLDLGDLYAIVVSEPTRNVARSG